jgi:ATP-binding cassette subfamily C protein PrsD
MRHNKSIVIVISHRPSALGALNMAMVLHEGRRIAFGAREEIFARVRGSPVQAAPAPSVATPNLKPARRAAISEHA